MSSSVRLVFATVSSEQLNQFQNCFLTNGHIYGSLTTVICIPPREWFIFHIRTMLQPFLINQYVKVLTFSCPFHVYRSSTLCVENADPAVSIYILSLDHNTSSSCCELNFYAWATMVFISKWIIFQGFVVFKSKRTNALTAYYKMLLVRGYLYCITRSIKCFPKRISWKDV